MPNKKELPKISNEDLEKICNLDMIDLGEIIGYELLLSVCKIMGGRKIYISKAPDRALRNREIRRDFRSILSTGKDVRLRIVYSRLADKYSLKEREIMRIVNG